MVFDDSEQTKAADNGSYKKELYTLYVTNKSKFPQIRKLLD